LKVEKAAIPKLRALGKPPGAVLKFRKETALDPHHA
jgi:hypothetical protein